MRDLALVILVFASLPLIMRRPFTGVIVWTWLGFMNPTSFTFSFAHSIPLAQIVFITTALSYIVSTEPKRFPLVRETFVLFLFVIWMCITTQFALAAEPAAAQLVKVLKVQLAIALTLMLTINKSRLNIMVWTTALSIGFYGVKGGIWVLVTGASSQVFGPAGSFFQGNNELGLALIMIVPLIWYLLNYTRNARFKYVMYAVLLLNLIAIMGTHSRGALVGVIAMSGAMMMKSQRKMLPLFIGAIFTTSVPFFMPDAWFERMRTITDYEQDSSAMGRIESWGLAVDYAQDKLLGGGYEVLAYFAEHDAHSIYFEVLAEHGFVGLFLFMSLGLLTWLKAGRVGRRAKNIPELKWALDLSSMLQVSMIGYAASGAFLGLAYFDLVYLLVAFVVVLDGIVATEIRQPIQEPSQNGVPSAMELKGA